jgi:hypothetical protein
MGPKGFAPLTVAIIGLIVIITAFLIPFIAISAFKYHIIASVKLNYEYNSADIVLLELLKLNKTYQYLAEMDLPSFEKYVMQKSSFIENLNNTLKLLTLSNCFKLSSNNIIVSSGTCETKNVTWTEIFVPYNPQSLVKKLFLEVG